MESRFSRCRDVVSVELFYIDIALHPRRHIRQPLRRLLEFHSSPVLPANYRPLMPVSDYLMPGSLAASIVSGDWFVSASSWMHLHFYGRTKQAIGVSRLSDNQFLFQAAEG